MVGGGGQSVVCAGTHLCNVPVGYSGAGPHSTGIPRKAVVLSWQRSTGGKEGMT